MLRTVHLGAVLSVLCLSVFVAVPASTSVTDGTIPLHWEASDRHGRWMATIGYLDEQLVSIIRRLSCTSETVDDPGRMEHRVRDLKRLLEQIRVIGRSIDSADDIAVVQHNGIDDQIEIIAAEISRLAARAATSLGEECATPFMAPPLDFGTKAGTGSISGTVTDSTTAAAITQGSIVVFDESGDFVAQGPIDSNGDYSTSESLPAGTYYAQTQVFAGYLWELYDNIYCTLDCDVTTGTPIIVGEGESVTSIDFALDTGGSISGTVTDAATDSGIENVLLNIYDTAGNQVAGGSTDSNGNYFTYQGLLAGTYFVRVMVFGGYFLEVYDDIPCALSCDVTIGTPVIVGEDEAVTGIDFALDVAASISGTVTDAMTGSGISTAFVTIRDSAGDQVTSATTGFDGDYVSFDGLVAGTYFAEASDYSGEHLDELYDDIPCASGCDATSGTPIVVGELERVTGIDFSLDEAGAISGHVTDAATGAAIEGERVRIYDASGEYITSGTTGADGAYESGSGLPAGTYFARVFSYSGFFNELYDDISCVSGCEVTTGTPIVVGSGEAVTGIDFSLDKAGSISGTLTDATSSNPIEGEQVRFYDATGNQITFVYSDENGFFTTNIGLVAGNYFARTYGSTGYLWELYDDIPCYWVCDDFPCHWSCEVITGTPIVVAAGEDVEGIDFALDAGATISGTVTDSATGDPIAGVGIDIYDSTGNWLNWRSTDVNGRYTTAAMLPGGTYFARISAPPPYLDELYDDLQCFPDCDVTTGSPIVVGTGEDVSGIDFALETGGSISGTLIDAGTLEPIEWEGVTIFDSSGNGVAFDDSGPNGDFTTGPVLPPGTYFVRTAILFNIYPTVLYDGIPCHNGCNVINGTPIDVGAGEHVTGIDFVLANGGTISGTVIDPATAQPIVNSQVNFFDAAGSLVTSALVHGDGAYETDEVLSAGTYYANTYNWAGYFDELYDGLPCHGGCDVTTGTPITVGVLNDVAGINFTLDKGGTISGVVTDAVTMLPIYGVRVEIYDVNGIYMGGDLTEPDGVYLSPSGLVAGTYFVSTTNFEGYADEVYLDIPCVGGCDVTVGTPVSVATGQDVTGIDFQLNLIPLFADNFETGNTSAWSSVEGGS